jgi:hypothetical protein
MFSGGYTITLVEEDPEKNSSFSCPNISCGKIFTKPLKAVNLQFGPDAFYDACPYCLTKISPNDRTAVVPVEESRSCQHYLGYLCEREKKTDIPDECMICKDIVACMLSSLKK